MLPHDLSPTRIELPPGPRDSAVLLTGPRPRHLRLGYHLQRRFPGLVRAWYVTDPPREARLKSKLDKARELLRDNPAFVEARRLIDQGEVKDLGDLSHLLGRVSRAFEPRRMATAAWEYLRPNGYDDAEARMFGRELEMLKAGAGLHPVVVASPNDKKIIAEIQAVDPYFLIALGGPLLKGRLLRCARGVALNQHAGWCPVLRGANTVETAIYHRNIDWIGSTVHVMNTFADAGVILRRSTATLHPDDGLGECFMAAVAAGTKMMIEVVERAIRDGEIVAFDQSVMGRTVNIIDYVPAKRSAVARDMTSDFLGDALRIAREY
jgi:folate-dependent phosphoribosylglycinamide formyltransferase PurN